MAKKTQIGAFYQPRGREKGGSSTVRGYMYTYGWFILRFDRKQQNSVKQSSFNKKIYYIKTKQTNTHKKEKIL